MFYTCFRGVLPATPCRGRSSTGKQAFDFGFRRGEWWEVSHFEIFARNGNGNEQRESRVGEISLQVKLERSMRIPGCNLVGKKRC